MRNIMNGSPVVQEASPNTIPLQCAFQENGSPNIQWQDFMEKGPVGANSKLLFLTVEYVQDSSNNDAEFNNYSPSMSENERLSPFDPNLSSSGRYSPLYNSLVIPPDGQSECQSSVVVLPASTNEQQINLVVDQLQVQRQLVVEDLKAYQSDELANNFKLNCQPNNSHSNLLAQIDSDQQSDSVSRKLMITSPARVVLSQEPKSDFLPNGNFFQGEMNKILPPTDFGSPIRNEYSSSRSHETVLLTERQDVHNKSLLNSSKYVIAHEKQDELMLSEPVQNGDLLIKPDGLMGVDSYSLTQTGYIASNDAPSYPTVEEQLNLSSIEKPDNEYMLPDAMGFEDTESSILQSNLEGFASQAFDNNGLLFYDKTRLRQAKKHPSEHLGFDDWCEECEFGMTCKLHQVKIISDKPVLSRARATLPKELLTINKLHSDQEGVFARKTIMRRVQFGPVEGKLLKNWDGSTLKDSDVHLLLEVETGQLLKLDVSDEHESNWMRFVRKATTLKEQNLILSQQGKSLFFTTTRVIPPRHELRVGYSLQYARKRKLAVLEDLSWNCYECTARFSTSDEFQKHLNAHESEKEFNERPKKKNRSVTRRGMRNLAKRRGSRSRRPADLGDKMGGKENECESCHKTFPRTDSLKRHMMLVHLERNKENSGEFKSLKEKTEKLSMTNTLFKKKHSNGTCSEWLCTHCNLTFDNPSVLNLHTLTHAAEDLESEAVLDLPSELSSVYHDAEFLVENGDVQCPQCTQEFPSKRQLIDHVSTHGKMTLKKCYSKTSKPYKCDQCYKAFPTDTRLQKHMLVHSCEEAKPYQCETCLKRFLNNSALSCHRKTHNDKKSFECPLCKKELDHVYGLRDHVKIHSSDGCFSCPHCNKVFEGYSVIRKHIRAFHSGLQHACKDCGKLCPTLDKLRMHSLKHSDHREFLCANCGKQFKRKDKLKEHMKRMHSAEREKKLMSLALRVPSAKIRRFTPKMSPPAYDRFIYKCRSCLLGFKRRGMLVNHLAKRHPEIVPETVPELNLPILKTTREYFCQYCDKIYKSSSKRKAHILKNHPGAELPMSNRQKGGLPLLPGIPNPTFSKAVGSVTTNPHRCKWCHKQYASKAKLLQHQRIKHVSLLPKSQQVPRPNKTLSSFVGSKIIESVAAPSQDLKARGAKDENNDTQKATEKLMVEADSQIDRGVFGAGEECTHDVDANYKKTFKALPENISCELLHQAVAELTQSLSEYKLPFEITQENLLKIIGSGEGLVREDATPAGQLTRSWPDLPPYPPR